MSCRRSGRPCRPGRGSPWPWPACRRPWRRLRSGSRGCRRRAPRIGRRRAGGRSSGRGRRPHRPGFRSDGSCRPAGSPCWSRASRYRARNSGGGRHERLDHAADPESAVPAHRRVALQVRDAAGQHRAAQPNLERDQRTGAAVLRGVVSRCRSPRSPGWLAMASTVVAYARFCRAEASPDRAHAVPPATATSARRPPNARWYQGMCASPEVSAVMVRRRASYSAVASSRAAPNGSRDMRGSAMGQPPGSGVGANPEPRESPPRADSPG